MQDEKPPDEAIEGTAEELPPEPDPSPPAEADAVADPGIVASPAPTAEIAVRAQGSTALIVAATAREKIEIAGEIATSLDDVIKRQGLRTKMGRAKVVKADGSEVWEDRYHVNVEGWQTLATLLDLAVIPVYARRIVDEHGRLERTTFPVHKVTTRKRGTPQETTIVEDYEVDGFSYEARVEVYKDGTLVGAGEAMCSRTEDAWKARDDHNLRSMAQTRATGRAIGAAARWIITLAGYSGTPDEEMPPNGGGAPGGGDAPPAAVVRPEASPDLRKAAANAMKLLVGDDAAPAVWEKVKADLDEGAKLPTDIARLLVHVATAARDAGTIQVPGDPAPAGEPEPTQAEKPAPGSLDDTPENRAAHCGCTDDHSDPDCPIHGIGF